jgi:hypothetical protein
MLWIQALTRQVILRRHAGDVVYAIGQVLQDAVKFLGVSALPNPVKVDTVNCTMMGSEE